MTMVVKTIKRRYNSARQKWKDEPLPFITSGRTDKNYYSKLVTLSNFEKCLCDRHWTRDERLNLESSVGDVHHITDNPVVTRFVKLAELRSGHEKTPMKLHKIYWTKRSNAVYCTSHWWSPVVRHYALQIVEKIGCSHQTHAILILKDDRSRASEFRLKFLCIALSFHAIYA